MNLRTALLLSLFALGAARFAFAEDWPNYLGPNHNGIVAEGSLRLNWKEAPPKTKWTRMIGVGCSSIAVAQGKALTLSNKNDRDTLWCFEALSGKLLWQHEYPEDRHDLYYAGGPSSTPTIDGPRVYTLSKSGQLFCLELESGKVLWKKHYKDDFNGRKSGWGWAASPLVHGDQLIIDPGAANGAVMALDKLTGEPIWKSGNFKPGYATPVVFEWNGKEALAVFHSKELAAYDLEDPDHKLLFSFPWRTGYGVNASNPHYYDGKMFLGSGYGSGYAVIDITKEKPDIVHRDRELSLKLQSTLKLDDRILAMFGDDKHTGELISLDFATGQIHWRQTLPGDSGNLIKVGEHFLVSTDSGHLILGTAGKDKFSELGRIQPLLGLSWALPAFANGHIYLRSNQGKLVCLDLSAN